MKSVISTTYDDQYLFFLPITTWLWNRLGVDVICFMPHCVLNEDKIKNKLVWRTIDRIMGMAAPVWFSAPKHKEATYAQCSRLYAACLDLPEDEILVTGDVDMGMFKLPVCYPVDGYFTIYGNDLVPNNQYPMCYISASVKDWRIAFEVNGRTYQQCLDDLVGVIECEHFRGNQWSLDQNVAYRKINLTQGLYLENRARPGTQFASNRIDRDDSFWEERLTPDIIDAHLWRPGYTDENFPKILKLLKYFYPYDNFNWLIEYREQYLKLL